MAELVLSILVVASLVMLTILPRIVSMGGLLAAGGVCIAVGLIFMRLVDLHWIIAPSFTKIPSEHGPSFHSTGFTLHWLDLVIPMAIGGLLISLFFSQLKKRPLIAQNDPRYADLYDSEE